MPFAPAGVVVEVAVSITGNLCRNPPQTLILSWLKPLRHELVANVAVAKLAKWARSHKPLESADRNRDRNKNKLAFCGSHKHSTLKIT